MLFFFFFVDLAFNPSTAKQGDAENDVIFVSEKMPTPQQAARAKQFMLPKTFYFFEDSDFKGCRGCIGCDPDNFDMDSIGQQSQDDDGKGSRFDVFFNQNTIIYTCFSFEFFEIP